MEIPSEFDEGVGEIGLFLKEPNLQASALNVSDYPMFQDSIISLKLNEYDFKTAAQTCITVEDNPFVHDAVVKAVIGGMDKSEEYE